MRHEKLLHLMPGVSESGGAVCGDITVGPFMNTLGCHEYLSLSWQKFQKKTPEQIVSVEGSKGREIEATSFSFHGVFSSLAKFTWFQADPANFNKQPCRKGCCTKVGMRMGQWAETEVIFIYIYYMIYLEHFEAPSCSLAGCSGATTNTPQRRMENRTIKTPALVVKLTSPRPHFWTQVFGCAGVWHTTPMGTVPRHVASAEFSTEVPPVDLRFGMLIVQAFRCFHSGTEMRLWSPVYKRFKTHCIFFKIRTHLRIYKKICIYIYIWIHIHMHIHIHIITYAYTYTYAIPSI